MMGYWLRLIGAWLLLRVASNMVKDAERLVKESSAKPESVNGYDPNATIESTATVVQDG